MIASYSGYNNDTIAYQYDELGRIVKRTVDTSSETFSYDALGRVTHHNNPLGNFAQTYLGETGQLTGLQDSTGKVGTSWQYDDNQHDRCLLGIQNSGATRSYGYVTTPENRISEINETTTLSGNWAAKDYTYGYDDADRLTSVDVSSGDQYGYTYDAGDNLTGIDTPKGRTAIAVNGLNQIKTVDATSYTYDANGNVTHDGVRHYAWDAENRLVKVALAGQPGFSYQMAYDGLGRRISITSSNGVMAPSVMRYLWCGDTLCQARTSADVVARRYYSEGELRMVGNAQLYYTRDHLGSVREVLNIKTGGKIGSFDYDAYGKPIQTAASITPDYLYAGMFNIQGVGLYLTNYRAYDPNVGRWVSRDPIEENGGVNTYTYVNGNPVNFTDPLGLKAWYCQRPLGDYTGKNGSGPPVFNHQFICITLKDGTTKCDSTNNPDFNKNPLLPAPGFPSMPERDNQENSQCKAIDDDKNRCFEECVFEKWRELRPPYAIGPLGTDCQEYSQDIVKQCRNMCEK